MVSRRFSGDSGIRRIMYYIYTDNVGNLNKVEIGPEGLSEELESYHGYVEEFSTPWDPGAEYYAWQKAMAERTPEEIAIHVEEERQENLKWLKDDISHCLFEFWYSSRTNLRSTKMRCPWCCAEEMDSNTKEFVAKHQACLTEEQKQVPEPHVRFMGYLDDPRQAPAIQDEYARVMA